MSRDEEDHGTEAGRRLTRDEKKKLGRKEADKAETLCDELLDLKPEILARVELEPFLRDAVLELTTLFARKERPRQLRHVQKMIRDSDMDAIAASIELARTTSGYDPLARECERWRDKLVAEGDAALKQFLDDHELADRTALRQAVQRAQRATKEAELARTKRDVFVLVRDTLAAESDQTSE